MSDCSCGGVSISCHGGCGCFCAGPTDCTRWCEPVQVEAAFSAERAREGGVVRTIKRPDGTDRLYLNAMATGPGGDLPRHAPDTPLDGCMQGTTLGSMALVLGILHGVTVTAPAGKATETLDGRVTGTLAEIAERYGLTVQQPAAN